MRRVAVAALSFLGGSALASMSVLWRLGSMASFVLGYSTIVLVTLAIAFVLPRVAAKSLVWLGLPVAAIAWASQLHGAALLPWSAALVAAALLGSGALVGNVVGQRVEAPSHLLLVAVISSLADLFSVLHPAGPSAHILNEPSLLASLAISWPFVDHGALAFEPVLGVGDVAFAAIYIAAAKVHGLSLPRTGIALAAGFAAAMLGVIALQRAIPVLPCLGAAIALVHPTVWRIRREERVPAIAGLLLALSVFVLLWWRV